MFYFEDTSKQPHPQKKEEYRLIFDGTARLDFYDKKAEIEESKGFIRSVIQYLKNLI